MEVVPVTPEELLASALRKLHLKAGKPSTRKIAGGVGGVSHTTVNEMLRGSRVPAWELVEKVGRFLEGDESELRTLWMATQKTPLPRGEAHNDLWDPVYLDRLVVTSFVSGKGTREVRTVERWIRATSDGVDRFRVRAAALQGISHAGSGRVNVEPYLNCTIGKVKPVKISEEGDAWLVDVLLAVPLDEGEYGFFATRSRYAHPARFTSYTETTITCQGAREVLIRVQFSSDSVPPKCWSYVGSSEIDMQEEPPAGSRRILPVSSSRYVDLPARSLPPGARVGVAWKWDPTNSPELVVR
ncbi:helix-turn-helix domain-containing protein [Amycolatopsis vancoresmycina]|uniref:HTH cro/C1-type domain-containing protein n=1 Tax=Amycolatopsis vancoresmycina DSM 44592 TaxID=1292037 RepID=R1IDV7_9PSEU|nr:helix-turn-helix domain-containing protein [Amycolatopsis vancoresmycina]EOD68574.1 hypothetical protein H480_10610 [Amycolatopsis vancoresmycina DSM 44592]